MYTYKVILKSLELYKTYKSKKYVSRITNISKTTIIRWIKKYNDKPTNLINIINKTFTHEKKQINIKNNIKKYIVELFTVNPFYTRNQIQNLILIKFNFKIGLRKLRKVIHSLNYTYKKAKYLVIKNKNYIEKLQKERTEFKNKIKMLNIDNIISIDESSFNNLYGSNLKGHSLKGQQINIPINEKKFINNSLLMALTTKTIIEHEIHINKINSSIFKSFIESVIKKNNLINYTFIFDNVSFHKNEETLNFIKKVVTIIYLLLHIVLIIIQ